MYSWLATGLAGLAVAVPRAGEADLNVAVARSGDGASGVGLRVAGGRAGENARALAAPAVGAGDGWPKAVGVAPGPFFCCSRLYARMRTDCYSATPFGDPPRRAPDTEAPPPVAADPRRLGVP